MDDPNHPSDESRENNKEVTSQNAEPVFSEDEEMLIDRMFTLVGERWSLIAGRIPGKTAEEIEKYWTSKYASSITHER
uniref:MYB15 protein n=1 Tax=Actinidia eriantha TaxID=165200 RepID=A0A346JM68_ACTER|nr:MYB15 protein [Actinidia eriantha]